MTEKEKLKKMSGADLLDYYLSKHDDYSGVVLDAYVRIRDDLFPLLEEAERSGKKIILEMEDVSSGILDSKVTITVG